MSDHRYSNLAIAESLTSLLSGTSDTDVLDNVDTGDGEHGIHFEPPVYELRDMPSHSQSAWINHTSVSSLPPARYCLRRGHSLKRALIVSLCFLLMMLGLLHIVQGVIRSVMFPNPLSYSSPSIDGLELHNHDIRNAQPVPCHSHNDYWRPRPLIDAISVGCCSVEADVWLVEGDLYVGHRLQDLDMNKSLRDMYLKPVLEMLDQHQEHNVPSPTSSERASFFHRYPNQTLVLLIDFKDAGLEAFHLLQQQLQPLKDKGYLTYYDGHERIDRALTVVATGQESVFQPILANKTHRDIFFDAPLASLWQPPQAPLSDKDHRTFTMDYGSAMSDGLRPAVESLEPFDATNSYYASVSFRSAVGYVWRGHLSPKQMRVIRGQINGAKRKGLKVRYWDTPTWPIALRNHVWHVLIKEGADILSVDDIRGCAMESWRAKKHAWYDWW